MSSFASEISKKITSVANTATGYILEYQGVIRITTNLFDQTQLNIVFKKDSLILRYLDSLDHELGVTSLEILKVTFWGLKVGFAFIKINPQKQIIDENGNHKLLSLPGEVFLRDDAVMILMVLKCIETGESFFLTVTQARSPTGNYAFEEVPAGMMKYNDLTGQPEIFGTMIAEIKEETAIELSNDDIVCMSQQDTGLYPSPGGCNEKITPFLFVAKASKKYIDSLHNRCTGVLEEGEVIKVAIRPFDYIWSMNDMKAIALAGLYIRLYGIQADFVTTHLLYDLE